MARTKSELALRGSDCNQLEDGEMHTRTMLIAGVAAAALAAAGAGTFAVAQQAGGTDVIGELANSEGIFVDGKTFKIARGKAKGDPAAQIAKLGAKEVG